MLSQPLAFENEVLASTSTSSLTPIPGDMANNCSATKAYRCDLGAEYAFLIVVVVILTALGVKHSLFTIYNVHALGLSG